MKIIIEIPEKTNAHIRSDYGHGVRGLRIEDMEMLVDAVYHGEPYEERACGEWNKDKRERVYMFVRECLNCKNKSAVGNFCMWCGADMRPKEGEEND